MRAYQKNQGRKKSCLFYYNREINNFKHIRNGHIK